jgi:hypothetical protein
VEHQQTRSRLFAAKSCGPAPSVKLLLPQSGLAAKLQIISRPRITIE